MSKNMNNWKNLLEKFIKPIPKNLKISNLDPAEP